ncbi:type II toxin-antitoxin system YafQ family toxin [Campylobacter jejuni]|nr:type II toxin-antitoxin system YafQ family toxin [Campylobacter jejuni]
MKFEIHYSKEFKKAIKKLNNKDREIVFEIIKKLSNNEILERKYKDHKLQGEFKDYRECHVKPDLLLIYQKQNDKLVLTCISVGSHSEIF